MARLFGTDGVRGLANKDITPHLALDLSIAAARVLGEASEFAGHGRMAIVGRDTRASGEFLSAAVVGGLAAAGVNVYDAGVLPTPAVAFLTADANADLGVMLTASHNPMPDNGIKFFSRGGHKLADAVEDAFEARLGEKWQGPTGINVGRVLSLQDGRSRYVAHLLRCLPNRLEGLKIVIDAAPGAAAQVSPEAFRAADAEVHVIGAEPRAGPRTGPPAHRRDDGPAHAAPAARRAHRPPRPPRRTHHPDHRRHRKGAPVSIDEKIKAASGQLLAGRPQITDGRLTVANLCAEAGVSRASFYRSPHAAAIRQALAGAGSGAPDATPRPETEELREQLRQLAKTQTALRSQHAAEVRALRATVTTYANQIQLLALRVSQLQDHNQRLLRRLERAGDNVTALPVPSPAAQGTADR